MDPLFAIGLTLFFGPIAILLVVLLGLVLISTVAGALEGEVADIILLVMLLGVVLMLFA